MGKLENIHNSMHTQHTHLWNIQENQAPMNRSRKIKLQIQADIDNRVLLRDSEDKVHLSFEL